MKHLLLTASVITFLLSQSIAQNPIQQSSKKDTMNRIERSKETYEKLFKQAPASQASGKIQDMITDEV